MANIMLKEGSRDYSGIVHSYGKHKNYTNCGAYYIDNWDDWKKTDKPVTCDKNGCK